MQTGSSGTLFGWNLVKPLMSLYAMGPNGGSVAMDSVCKVERRKSIIPATGTIVTQVIKRGIVGHGKRN
jgi:hypothetical protein